MQQFLLMGIPSNASLALAAILVTLVLICVMLWLKPMPSNAKYAGLGIVIAVIGVFSYVLYRANDAKIILTPDQLIVDIPLYKQTLSLSEIQFQQVSFYNANDPELSPKWRQNGMGLPGYLLGWFKLKNGDKALMSSANMQHGVMIPTTQGYTIIVSVQQPKLLLEQLQALSVDGS
ncbi:PH domain-containing protein [Shewanella maritima]|uniref:PH domain-containing protein n=1 Tax=Shewanella maritima TaxID=2520507 RepID=UPI003736299F